MRFIITLEKAFLKENKDLLEILSDVRLEFGYNGENLREMPCKTFIFPLIP